MASSMLTGDRKWGQARKSGMTVLGKVPKPINLPSQRLENHGLDPNVEIVPKGTFTWGSRSSVAGSNVWGSTMSSPNTDGSTGSPSYVNGSYTRPSTATSDKSYHATTGAWAPNSRPSSSSGILPDHPTVVATRPRSAETTHGGPHQSYIGESTPEPSAWGPSRTHEKLIGALKPNRFNLSSGDFPTLSAEKTSKSSVVSQEGDSHMRPASASGRVSTEKEEPTVDQPSLGNEILASGNMQPYKNDTLPQNSERWRRDQPQIQPYPYHFDSWSGAHMTNAPEAMWFRGPPPGGIFRPGGPAGYPVDPYAFYHQIPARALTNSQAYGPMNGTPTPYQIAPPVFDHNGPMLMSPPKSMVDSGDIHAETFSHAQPLTVKEVDHDNRPRFRVLLKQHDRLKVNDSVEKKDQPLASVPELGLQKDEPVSQTSCQIEEQKILAPSKRNSSLIDKIENLNNRARGVEAIDEISSNDALLSDSPALRKSHSHSKSKLNVKKGEEWRNKSHISSSSSSSVALGVDNAENHDGSEMKDLSEAKVDEKPYAVSGTDSDDIKAQHVRMKEMARQRAKQLQIEEEERTREQKARALAKLEELNRRANQPPGQPPLMPEEVSNFTPEEPATSDQQNQASQKQSRKYPDVIPENPNTKKANYFTLEEPTISSQQKQGPRNHAREHQDVISSLPRTHKVEYIPQEQATSAEQKHAQKSMREHHDVIRMLSQDPKVNHCSPEETVSQPKQKFVKHAGERQDGVSALQKAHKENEIIPEEPVSSALQNQKFQMHMHEQHDVKYAPPKTCRVNDITSEEPASSVLQKSKFQKYVHEHHDVIPVPQKTRKVNDSTPGESGNSTQQKQKFQKHVQNHHDIIPSLPKAHRVKDSNPKETGPLKHDSNKQMWGQHDVIHPRANTNKVNDSIPEEPAILAQRKPSFQKQGRDKPNTISQLSKKIHKVDDTAREELASSAEQKQALHPHVQNNHDVIPGGVLVGSIIISSERLMSTDSAGVDPPSMPEKNTKNGGRTRNRSKTDESTLKEKIPDQEAVRPNKQVEEEPTKPTMQWKPQNQRKVTRNPSATVVWAPVKSTAPPPSPPAQGSDDVGEVTSSKSKRAEMERYVPKPIMAQENYQQMSSPKAANGSTEKSMGQASVDLKAVEPGRPNKNGGKLQSSWRRRSPPKQQAPSNHEENNGPLSDHEETAAAQPGVNKGRRQQFRGHRAAVEPRSTTADSDDAAPGRKINDQPKSQWQLKSTQPNLSDPLALSQVNHIDFSEPGASKRQTEKREKRGGDDPQQPPPEHRHQQQHGVWANAGPRHGRRVNADQHGNGLDGKYRERAHRGQQQLPRQSQISASADPR